MLYPDSISGFFFLPQWMIYEYRVEMWLSNKLTLELPEQREIL